MMRCVFEVGGRLGAVYQRSAWTWVMMTLSSYVSNEL
jgi:hypothetical protein